MKRKFISLVLALAVLFSEITIMRTNVNATMLPLKEVNAYLVLSDYSEEQIKSMPLKDVLSLMQDKDGNYINIPSSAEVVWAHFKDDNGNVIHDEYHVIDREETVDLSEFEYTTGYTMELIVGSGKQLDAGNIRYLVRVYITKSVFEDVKYELYTQTEDDTRVKVVPEKTLYEINDQAGIPLHTTGYLVSSHVPNTKYYLGITSKADEHPDIKLDIYTFEEFQKYLISGSGKTITDQILGQNMKDKDAGYKCMLEVPSSIYDTVNMFCFVYTEKSSGSLIDMNIHMIVVSNDMTYVDGELFSYENNELVDNTLFEVDNTNASDIGVDFGSGAVTTSSSVAGKYYMLKEGYSADSEYYFALNAHSDTWTDDANGHVVKAVVGHYNTLEDAINQEDIKDQLIPVNRSSQPYGYKANYNYRNKGKDFTVFFDDGAVFKFNVRVSEYDPKYDNNKVMRNFDEAPIVGAKDYWFRVNGVKEESNLLDTYIVENGKAINMDTLYGYGYQTIFINNKKVDLSKLKPTFWYGDAERVETYIGSKQESGVSVQDFSNGSKQYSTIIDDNVKNYNVTIVKKESGSKLFVNGPSTRAIFLDEYFEYKHDILIANIGDKELTGLKVKLDATNVKLDDYWTVGGEKNDSLAPFTTTSSDSKYGELGNISKIRLLPDGDGEVSGTLTISADGQEDVVIKLTGRASNPKIITEKLDEAVKYVPYSYVVSTDNMNDWNSVKFSIESGELPKGLELYPTTGEIYGVPQETGTFNLKIKASYGRSDYFKPSYADLKLVVKENTNENVYLESDEGYAIKHAIGKEVGQYDYELDVIEDTIFTSYGEYDNFVDLWLNGEKLEEGVDYEKEEGSTKITIKSQTIEEKANKEKNTIAAEYRENNGDRNSDLKRTSQNFRVTGKTSAQKVIDKINSLPSNVTLDDKNGVQSARKAYDALSQSEKKKVTNYNKLVNAENRIARLEQEAKDKAVANKVAQMINNLPSTITLNDKAAVVNARNAYETLTATQKGYVSNLVRLKEAENAIATLEKLNEEIIKDKAEASKVIDLISKIPDKVTLDNKNDINDARKSYNKLTSSQKAFVTNYDKLLDAEKQILELEKEDDEIESVTMVGILVDKNGKGLSDKSVEIHSAVQSGITDPNGSFLFNNVEFGTHTIYVKDSKGNIEAQKDFNIILGSPLSINGNDIVVENHSVFTVEIKMQDDQLTFLNIKEGNQAPEIDTNKEDELNQGIKISESENLESVDSQNTKNTKTGDNTNLELYYGLIFVSLAGIILLMYLKKRIINHNV